MESIVKHRYWWFLISLLVIVPGAISLAMYGLRLGIDFSGGALWDVQFSERQPGQVDTDTVAAIFSEQGFPDPRVQLSEATVDGKQVAEALVRTRRLSAENPAADQTRVLDALSAQLGSSQLVSIQSVGETVSAESTRSAVFAVLGACLAILIYLTVAFRRAPHPFRYGVCAILAMLHDVLVVIGVASILGVTIGLEIDALFLTALLTVISFSVHDTIVVFDRIRENLLNRRGGESFEEVVNHSIVQTMPRSINTQLTTLFTLVALLLFGGATIQHFVLILLVGLLSGTFSSIFNAAQLLVVWENREWERWFGRRSETAAA
ncbi:MAG TPA: protein translocase subunit SecF [Roseiflexaceae bacterium]|nr:protein translocase subunit SecF [Roseiflexaceae bacterium]